MVAGILTVYDWIGKGRPRFGKGRRMGGHAKIARFEA
jgi:hypothetical protein